MTAFRFRLGLFLWLITPFGFDNAPATFQRYINEQLREHLDLNATACIDDVLAYTGGSEEDHWKTVRSILGKLEKAGLCFIINAGKSVTVDPAKVKAIMDWQAPTQVRGIISFLGFANFYRCFVDGFSELVGLLVDLTKNSKEWQRG